MSQTCASTVVGLRLTAMRFSSSHSLASARNAPSSWSQVRTTSFFNTLAQHTVPEIDKALGVPQETLDSFPPAFQQGMAARAEHLGDTGDSAPENWEAPLGSPDVHLALAALSPDA